MPVHNNPHIYRTGPQIKVRISVRVRIMVTVTDAVTVMVSVTVSVLVTVTSVANMDTPVYLVLVTDTPGYLVLTSVTQACLCNLVEVKMEGLGLVSIGAREGEELARMHDHGCHNTRIIMTMAVHSSL